MMNNDTGMDDPLGDPTFDAALNIHQFLRNDRVSLADTEPPPAVPIDIDPMFPQDVLERVPIYATPARDPSSAPVNHVNGTVHLSALNKEQDSSEESGDLNLATKMEIEFNPLPRSSLSTGLCYDVRMRFHHELRQHGDVHPEDPRRIWAIYTELCEAGLVADTLAPGPPKKDLLARIPARHASIEEICLVHTRAHYDFVDDTRNMSQEDLIELDQGDSIYFNRSSYLCAILSAGGAIETCRAVAAGLVKNAIAVIRPPGHHAEESRAMGFCLFDNVAIAARVCQADFGENCRKILILDWDVHHGNGVQQAFYEDPNVLYISIHVHKDGTFYPSGPSGDHKHCGAGPGLGKNVNIPWSTQGMGDGDYMFAFQNVVMPIAYEFNPDFVIIAAGFDAAAGDELGGCFVTPPCYAHMTHMLMSLANGKIAVCLEGGYNLRSISKSALAVTRTLMGEPPDRSVDIAASKLGVDVVQRVVRRQSRHWRCMYPKDIEMSAKHQLGGQRLHDIIRNYQSKVLYENHKMINLFVLRDRLSKSFENQVLATTNYHGPRPLIVIFHDPPELMGIPDPTTNRLELHNTWLTDVLKDYIGWAVSQGYAVIDVNIPKHVTDLEDPEGYVETDRPRRITMTEELATYLWENYIECNEPTEIFFLGVGDAYHGLLHILMQRDTCYPRVSAIINFVAENALRRVESQNMTWLADWYYKNSRIFVASDHFVWSPERKPPKKRFGKLVKSPKVSLNEMLKYHEQDVRDFVVERIELARRVREGKESGRVERGIVVQ